MAHRKQPLHYSEIFGSDGTSSSVPLSSSDLEEVLQSQMAERVSRTPPPPASYNAPPAAPDGAPPATAAGVHPDLLLPPSALYARYAVDDLLGMS